MFRKLLQFFTIEKIPDDEYEAPCKCTNCDFAGMARIKKRSRLVHESCPNCQCPDLVPVSNGRR